MYISANFDKCIQLCNFHHNQEFNKPIPPKQPCAYVVVTFSPVPAPLPKVCSFIFAFSKMSRKWHYSLQSFESGFFYLV